MAAVTMTTLLAGHRSLSESDSEQSSLAPGTSELARLQQQVARLADEQARLRDRVAAIEAGRGLRDEEDYALVLALVASTRGLDFSAAALWRHASVDPVLADALEAADIDSPRSVGKFLRRVSGHTVAGWRIEQVGTSREGIRWRLRVCEFDTPSTEAATLPE